MLAGVAGKTMANEYLGPQYGDITGAAATVATDFLINGSGQCQICGQVFHDRHKQPTVINAPINLTFNVVVNIPK